MAYLKFFIKIKNFKKKKKKKKKTLITGFPYALGVLEIYINNNNNNNNNLWCRWVTIKVYFFFVFSQFYDIEKN